MRYDFSPEAARTGALPKQGVEAHSHKIIPQMLKIIIDFVLEHMLFDPEVTHSFVQRMNISNWFFHGISIRLFHQLTLHHLL